MAANPDPINETSALFALGVVFGVAIGVVIWSLM